MYYLMWVLSEMCMTEMLVCRVSMMQPSPVWYLWFWLTMVANYFDYFVFQRLTYSFDGSNLDCSIVTRLGPVSSALIPIRVL